MKAMFFHLSGHFGKVYVGTLAPPHDLTQGEIVAIKTVKGMYH